MTPATSAHRLPSRGRHRLALVGLATVFFIVALAGVAYACLPWGGKWEAYPVDNVQPNERGSDRVEGKFGQEVMRWCTSSENVTPAKIKPSNGVNDTDVRLEIFNTSTDCDQPGTLEGGNYLVTAVNSAFSELALRNAIPMNGDSFDRNSVGDTDRHRDCMTRTSLFSPNAPNSLFYLDNQTWDPTRESTFDIADISLNSGSGVGGLVPSNGPLKPSNDGPKDHVPWNSVAGICVSRDVPTGHEAPEGIMLPVEILPYDEGSVPGSNV
jgi:hypothetical protein